MAEWSKALDCKSSSESCVGSNPTSLTVYNMGSNENFEDKSTTNLIAPNRSVYVYNFIIAKYGIKAKKFPRNIAFIS